MNWISKHIWEVLLASILINVIGLYFVGQRIYWGYLRSHFVKTSPNYVQQSKRELFSSLSIGPEDIVFIGNSIIDACEWSELFNNKHIKNRGIRSDNIKGIHDRIDLVITGKPRKIFIMAGINDLIGNRGSQHIKKYFEKICLKVEHISPTTQVYIFSVLPINRRHREFKFDSEEIIETNKQLKALSEKSPRLTFIELHNHFLNEYGELDSVYSYDGMHLNGQGYVLWKELAEGHVEEDLSL